MNTSTVISVKSSGGAYKIMEKDLKDYPEFIEFNSGTYCTYSHEKKRYNIDQRKCEELRLRAQNYVHMDISDPKMFTGTSAEEIDLDFEFVRTLNLFPSGIVVKLTDLNLVSNPNIFTPITLVEMFRAGGEVIFGIHHYYKQFPIGLNRVSLTLEASYAIKKSDGHLRKKYISEEQNIVLDELMHKYLKIFHAFLNSSVVSVPRFKYRAISSLVAEGAMN
jgi:hypothetical protein